MPADPPPRRKWHRTRWLIVLIVATLSWSGWRAYAFRDALSEAKALGWEVEYTDPVEEIRKNWKAAFNKETWLGGVTWVSIPTGGAFDQHVAIVHRLNPKILSIANAPTLRDLSALKDISRLNTVEIVGCKELKNVDALNHHPAIQRVYLVLCTGLTNVDALKNLSALRVVSLAGCTGLTNVDALKNLTTLQSVYLTACMGLTKEGVAALKAALPKAEITGP